jgi:hypothetical protein
VAVGSFSGEYGLEADAARPASPRAALPGEKVLGVAVAGIECLLLLNSRSAARILANHG